MSISGVTGLGNLLGGIGHGAGQNALQSNGTNPYQNAAAQQMSYPSNLTSATINTATIGTSTWGVQGVKTINEQDLQHDAMKAPLSALIDMWTMRFQGEWVSESEFQEDDFWRLALIRLMGANKLEKHNLANSYSPVYRIIE